jgi:nicotinamidase-related amidase
MFDPSKTVLLPIDMQQAFDEPRWPRRWNSAVDANGCAVLAAWRAAGLPIIHVRHDSTNPSSSMAPGGPGNAMRPGFEPREG